MPALPPVPGACKVVWGGFMSDTNNWANKLYVSYTGSPPTSADLTTYAGAIQTALITDLIPLMDASTTIEQVEVTDLSSDLGAVGLSVVSTPGSRTGALIPASAAMLISYHALRHWRGGHPRSYLPVGVQPDLQTQTTWTTAFATACHTAMTAILTALLVPAGGFLPAEHVNVSYFGGVPPVGGKSVRRVVPLIDNLAPGVSTAHLHIATQRRRLGEH